MAASIEHADADEVYWAVTLLGTATVYEDRERRQAAAERIFPKHLGTDVGEWEEYYRRSIEEAPGGFLVEVDVGSATAQVY